jgi:F-type H+-transporting ATPase subunit epsilon
MIYGYEHSRSYPDRVICSTTADEIVLPGLTGQVGVLDGHAALITALDTGLLRIKLNEKWTPIMWWFSGN